jgi:uncharacterized protein (TIGR02231 family)
MKIKTLFFAILIQFVFQNAGASEIMTVSSKIEEATVFFKGAELIHTATAVLQKGGNELSISGLSPNIDRNSVKIKTSGSVLVSSFEFSVDYLTEKSLSAEAQKIQAAVKEQQKLLEQLQTSIKINANLLKILQESIEKNTSGSENGLNIDDLIKTMDYYKTKAGELENAIADGKEKETEANKRLQELKAQLEQESLKNNRNSGVLKLNLTAPAAGTCNFIISYFTPSAGWTPYYDVNVAATNQPVRIVSKAKVRQVTGIDWEKVRINLSSAMPRSGNVAPLFNAWFLRYMDMGIQLRGRGDAAMMQNMYSYAKAAPQAAMEMERAEVMEDAEAIYDEPASMDDYVTRSENQLNLTYNIDLPYTIPGNGKEQSIELKNQEVNASFKYYCAPKLDIETYLLAEITDWEKLNLLSGSANITYDGTYVGETYIDASSTQQNLTLTLGVDKRIAVKREKMKEYSSAGLFGNDVRQEFAYQMTVRNNRNEVIRMVLKDQYPISTLREITVELSKDTTTPTINLTELGVITWEYDMQPGETSTFKLVYSVKYPKGRTLNL